MLKVILLSLFLLVFSFPISSLSADPIADIYTFSYRVREVSDPNGWFTMTAELAFPLNSNRSFVIERLEFLLKKCIDSQTHVYELLEDRVRKVRVLEDPHSTPSEDLI